MEQDFYRSRLEDAHGLEVLIPDRNDRETVHQIIHEELCQGTIRDASRESYLAVDIPLFDTTRLHAEHATEGMLRP